MESTRRADLQTLFFPYPPRGSRRQSSYPRTQPRVGTLARFPRPAVDFREPNSSYLEGNLGSERPLCEDPQERQAPPTVPPQGEAARQSSLQPAACKPQSLELWFLLFFPRHGFSV